MDSASKTNTVDICLVNMESRGTITLAMELDSGQSMAMALVVGDVELAAMDHFAVEVSLVAVVVVSTVMSAFVDRFYSAD